MSTYVGNTLVAGSTCSPTLLDYKWADHLLNDISWLRADTFSWQSGDIYEAVYNHLVDDCTDKEGISETIAGITIWYVLADDGHKICPATEEANVRALYNKTGNAWYYILDATNKQFKLPYKHSQQIVQSIKNTDGSWYRLYADGWVEQGGYLNSGTNWVQITLPIEMSDTKYIVSATSTDGVENITTIAPKISTANISTTYFRAMQSYNSGTYYGGKLYWQVNGQSALDMSKYQSNEKHLYFYVGNFTKTALENTAGATTESINDINMHKVIAFQAPTAENNYTWYRLYADGWVEQGGRTSNFTNTTNATSGDKSVSLPIVMQDSYYTTVVTRAGGSSGWSWRELCVTGKTTSGFTCAEYNNNAASGTTCYAEWQVSGMAA